MKPLKIDSISIPSISSGVFGFPKDKCVKILVDTVKKNSNLIQQKKRVRFVNIDEATTNEFLNYMRN